MKSFAEFYRQVSKYRLLKEEDSMVGDVASSFAMSGNQSNLPAGADIDLGMGQDPVPLSKIARNPAIAQSLVKNGLDDGADPSDDKIKATFENLLPTSFKPTQATLKPDKVKGMIETGIDKPEFLSNMEAIVSQDNAIMDGHHRWAAALVLYPQTPVKVLKIGLPLEKLITVLNAYTVGELGVTQGNAADGDSITQAFDKLRSQLPQIPQEKLGKVPGANGDPNKGLQILMANLDAIPATSKANATNLDRVDMPVIPPDGMDKTAVLNALQSALNDGKVDLRGPLSSAVRKALIDAGVSVGGVGMAGAQATPTHNQNIQGLTNQNQNQNQNNAGSILNLNQNNNKGIKTSGPNANSANRGGFGGNVPPSNNMIPSGVSFSSQPQNASTFHPGLNMSEQLLVLSGVLTIEQAENNLNKRKRR